METGTGSVWLFRFDSFGALSFSALIRILCFFLTGSCARDNSAAKPGLEPVPTKAREEPWIRVRRRILITWIDLADRLPRPLRYGPT